MKHCCFYFAKMLAFVGLFAVFCQTASAAEDFPPVEEARELLRQMAAIVEKEYASSGAPEARGLSARVAALLERPLIPASEPASVAEKLVAQMRSAAFSAAMGFPELDRSLQGYTTSGTPIERLRKLRELRAGADSLETLYQIWEETNQLEQPDESNALADELVKRCRENTRQHPADADAHALLADVLLRTKNDLKGAGQAVRRALELSAGHAHACYIELELEAREWMLSAAGPLPQGEELGEALRSKLAANPLQDEALRDFGARAQALQLRLDALEAATSGLGLLLRCLSLRKEIEYQAVFAAKAAELHTQGGNTARKPTAPYSPGVFRDMATARKALRLASHSPEASSAVFLVWLKDEVTKALLRSATGGEKAADSSVKATLEITRSSGRRETRELRLGMPEAEREFFTEVLARLEKELRDASGQHAALLHETFCKIDLLGIFQGRMDFRSGHLFEALRLAPWLGGLHGLFMAGMDQSYQDDRLAAALLEIRHALDPRVGERRALAAHLFSLGDRERASALLAQSQQQAPEDFLVWNQTAVFALKSNSAAEGIQKADAAFEKARTLPSFQSAALKDDHRLLVVRNYLLFLAMQGRWEDAIETAESYRKEQIMPPKESSELLELLRRLWPASQGR